MSIISDAVLEAYRASVGLSGVAIVYARGAVSVSMVAIPGETQQQIEQGGQVIDEFHSRDYIFPVTNFASVAIDLPKRHDTITEGTDIYSVLDVDGDGSWQYTDETKVLIRVRTRKQ